MTYWNLIKARNFLLILLTTVVAGQTTMAQNLNVSPFSRFGLGDISDRSHAEQFSMGGLSIPVMDPFALNVANPASYTSLARPAFAVGMRLHLLNIHSANETQSNYNHLINNLAVAFPLAKGKWGLALGVMPFSTIGYDITQRGIVSDTEEEIRFDYLGEGGISRAYAGTAYEVYSKSDTAGNRSSLSAGLNASYLFGSLNRIRKSMFNQGSQAFNARVTDSFRMDELSIDLGLNFMTHLHKMTEDDKSFTKFIAGATFRVPKSLNIKGSQTAETYTVGQTTNIESAKDTAYYVDYNTRNLRMPMAIGVGAALDIVNRKSRKIMIGMQYEFEQWSEFNQSDETQRVFDDFGDSHRVTLGMDFMPLYRSSRNPLLKTHYRVGVRYEQMSLTLNNQQLDAYGISFGVGVPISIKRPQTPSTFNIGVELGQRGTTENNLLREDYVMITFGLTLMPHFRNAWFVQRKYD